MIPDNRYMSRSVRELLRSRLGIAVIGCALGCIPARMSEGAALKVSPGGDIKSINRAVQLAQPGDRIEIAAGVYREDSILIDKRLEINGVPGAVVDGAGGGEIITITADSVVIQGLELRNSEISYIVDHAAVRVDGARGCVIRRNVFRDNFFAVYLGKAVDCMISGNRIIGSRTSEAASGNGIHLWYCRGITVTGNYVSGHRDGIYFEFVEQGTVSGNISEGNLRYGLHFMFSDSCTYEGNRFSGNGAGVAVMYTRHVRMIDNEFSNNWGGGAYGLLLKEITDSEISGSRFHGNSVGVFAEGVIRATVSDCQFTENGWAIKIRADSDQNLFTANNFIGNTFDVATNSRQNYSVFDGNYWSSYSGYDLDRDGAGDIPYHPVSLFSLIVEKQPPALALLRSAFVDLLEVAERALPALTPETLVDNSPRMEPLQ